MARPIRIRLSDAQASAIECRDIIDDPASPGARAFTGSHLVFDPQDAEALADWLLDASNSEDAAGEYPQNEPNPELRKFARRAAKSLAVLFDKVSKVAWALENRS